MRAVVLVLAFAGCYSPSLSNPGFYCHPEDNPACPDGQMCINGRCTAQNVVVTGDMGGVGGGGTDDMQNSSNPDLAKPADMSKTPADLSQGGSPDLSQGGSCGMTGAACTSDADCCSGSVCFPGLNICF